MSVRVGHGYDVHRLAPGEALVLGGVTIEHDLGTVAHSDGDVLLHAIADALLGAAGLGDIGEHFPDSDPEFRGISSRKLLRRALALVREQDLVPGNLDCTLIAQRPKLLPYRDAMRQNIAADTGLVPTCVNVKATTTEGLGIFGREEAIAAHAVCTLVPSPPA